MIGETAPYTETVETVVVEENPTTIDINQINQFQQRISICGTCEKSVSNNGIPFCSDLNTPLVVATNNVCPLEKW